MRLELELEELGTIIMDSVGGLRTALDAYRLNLGCTAKDIGCAALFWGDINRDGTLN